MKSIAFMGASGEVTGSSYIVTAENGEKLMVDFGMFQGTDDIVALNYQPMKFKASELKGVVLTHAHLDHCGRLPMLVFKGFAGADENYRLPIQVITEYAWHNLFAHQLSLLAENWFPVRRWVAKK